MLASALPYSPFVTFADNTRRSGSAPSASRSGSSAAGRDVYEIDDQVEALLEIADPEPNSEEMRRNAVATGLDAVGAALTADGAALASRDAAILLHWLPDPPPSGRAGLVDTVRRGPQDSSAILARWLVGDLTVAELCTAAELMLAAASDSGGDGGTEFGEETASGGHLPGPWNDPNPSPLLLVQRLHVVFLALRHGRLGLHRAEESTVERWLESLRRHIADEIVIGDQIDEGDTADLAVLFAYASEMWRETVPHARPIRPFLERRTRQLWNAHQRGPRDLLSRALLLVTVGNLRLDDLVWEGAYGPLVSDQDTAGLWTSDQATVLTGQATAERAEILRSLLTSAVVLRTLRGPRRRGPSHR